MRAESGLGDAAWDDLVLTLPEPHVLQSSAWGAIKSRWGWSVHRFAWGEPGAEWAAAQVLVRAVAAGRARLGYVPRGPLVAPLQDPTAWARVLDELESWARSARLLALKMDPGLPRSCAAPARVWADRGWRPALTQVQFPNTMASDLSRGPEGLLGEMKGKTRYNIRLAAKRGVTVRPGAAPDLRPFFLLYAATAARGQFAVRRWPYYRDAWSAFLDRGMGALLLAEREGELLAGALTVAFGDTAWYLYGASADAGREHMPAYLVQWQSLLWAMERGCRRYDWWGGPTVLEPGDPLWGVYRFKRGFGAALVEQIGAWDYPVSPRAFRLYRVAERARGAWLRARRRGLRRRRGGQALRYT